jgi:hypothetical protein
MERSWNGCGTVTERFRKGLKNGCGTVAERLLERLLERCAQYPTLSYRYVVARARFPGICPSVPSSDRRAGRQRQRHARRFIKRSPILIQYVSCTSFTNVVLKSFLAAAQRDAQRRRNGDTVLVDHEI